MNRGIISLFPMSMAGQAAECLHLYMITCRGSHQDHIKPMQGQFSENRSYMWKQRVSRVLQIV